jgi:AbrB family looped-hinge helix DNA binding protein
MTHDQYMSHLSKMSSNGRIVIPADVRQVLGLTDGSTVVFTLVDGKVEIESAVVRARRARDKLASLLIDKPGISMADELIAERRAAAAKGD